MIMALAGVLVGAGLGLAQRPKPMSSPSPAPSAGTVSPVMIEVHVSGWVVSPGVVSVGEGSLTADVIMAAGGLRAGARVDTINLAAPVTAGQQLIVTGPGGLDSAPGGGGGVVSGGLVAVNRATAAELEALPGVGPVLAGRIVSHRDQHGPFDTAEDLLGVPGIGEAKLAAIRDLITVP
jgi:competence protein ComEA